MSVDLVHVFGYWLRNAGSRIDLGGTMGSGGLLEAEFFAELANRTHLPCFDLFGGDA